MAGKAALELFQSQIEDTEVEVKLQDGSTLRGKVLAAHLTSTPFYLILKSGSTLYWLNATRIYWIQVSPGADERRIRGGEADRATDQGRLSAGKLPRRHKNIAEASRR